MNETTIVYNSQKSGYLVKCWSASLKPQNLTPRFQWVTFHHIILAKIINLNELYCQSFFFKKLGTSGTAGHEDIRKLSILKWAVKK